MLPWGTPTVRCSEPPKIELKPICPIKTMEAFDIKHFDFFTSVLFHEFIFAKNLLGLNLKGKKKS